MYMQHNWNVQKNIFNFYKKKKKKSKQKETPHFWNISDIALLQLKIFLKPNICVKTLFL